MSPAIRKPRDPDMPASAPGVPVTPADVEAKLRRAGELKLDVELAASYMAHVADNGPESSWWPAKSELRRSLEALHGMLVDEIRRIQ